MRAGGPWPTRRERGTTDHRAQNPQSQRRPPRPPRLRRGRGRGRRPRAARHRRLRGRAAGAATRPPSSSRSAAAASTSRTAAAATPSSACRACCPATDVAGHGAHRQREQECAPASTWASPSSSRPGRGRRAPLVPPRADGEAALHHAAAAARLLRARCGRCRSLKLGAFKPRETRTYRFAVLFPDGRRRAWTTASSARRPACSSTGTRAARAKRRPQRAFSHFCR